MNISDMGKPLGTILFRWMQGANITGMVINAILNVIEIYGIYTISEYGIPLPLFLILGVFSFVGMCWIGGFIMEKTGMLGSMTSHINNNTNLEFRDLCSESKIQREQLDRIEKSLQEIRA